jgi:hypothetical protein
VTIEPILTRVGFVGHDELRFRGYRVFGELLGRTTATQAIVLGVSGHLLSAAQAQVIDDIITAMSSADPRMWPFKIVRLASSYGSAPIGVAAGLIGADGGIFGPHRLRDAAVWLTELRARGPLSDDQLAGELDRGGRAFGVLYRNRDERFDALMKLAVQRGRAELPHVALCRRAALLGRTLRQTEAHVFLGVAALALDLGLPLDAIAALATVLLFHDGIANATEGAAQTPSVLRELPRDRVGYRGAPARTSPRAAGR